MEIHNAAAAESTIADAQTMEQHDVLYVKAGSFSELAGLPRATPFLSEMQRYFTVAGTIDIQLSYRARQGNAVNLALVLYGRATS